jgi:hypothetical protein
MEKHEKEVTKEQLEEAGNQFRAVLKTIGREDLADKMVLWFQLNQRKMTAKEFSDFLAGAGKK